jgi:hypothetical protein
MNRRARDEEELVMMMMAIGGMLIEQTHKRIRTITTSFVMF